MKSSKPGKVTTLAVLTLVSGIVNILWSLGVVVVVLSVGIATFGLGCLLLPLAVYPLVLGILEILYAMKLLPDAPQPTKPAKWLAIMQICDIVTGNVISLVIGIVSLVFYSDPEVEDYFNEIAPPS